MQSIFIMLATKANVQKIFFDGLQPKPKPLALLTFGC